MPGIAAFLLLAHEAALIAESNTQAAAILRGLFEWIPIIVCIARRKNAIGGWLLFFLWCVVAGNAMMTFVALTEIETYLPRTWESLFLYSMFLASTLPNLAVNVSLLIASIALVRIRSWAWVLRIRWILAAGALTSLIAVFIDANFIPPNVATAASSLVFPAVFLPYMLLSKRVRRVFLTKDWESRAQPASFADRKPRRGIIYTESELEAMREREHPHDPRDTLNT